ncbi:metallophosphoesterase [Flavobacterium sp. GT3R68]|uniref:T9SS type A sorting domain-containing protein n=1 Tax=Flavobacterium sp. GT3R68 TaxID=2594437 RepID=UPI000F85DC2C|nr:metallophosphoesterase [Flavobacterium sp. GT3R68]RTY93896.1 T9SS type A sorting domain-containing protein [Flavobacterium sp. GSN2]TRW93490.1 T9SS type A sorting domain-containing protein [Flavobacterium sp. GT3R68]
MKNVKKLLFGLLCCAAVYNMSAQTTLIPTGSSWKYLSNGSNQGTAWKGTSFGDTSWSSGLAQLGYGDGDEATTLSYGTSSTNKYITTYFRKNLTVTNPTAFVNYTMNVRRDDGVVVYINGVEVYRNNMPAGTVSYTTKASTACSDDGSTFLTSTLTQAQAGFVAGTNTIAVEIHQNAINSSDISFDMSLVGNATAASTIKHIRWGSSNNPLEGLTVTWRNTGTTSQIKWGYTTACEQGTFPAVVRNGYADKFYNYTFPTVTANATIYYQLYDAPAAVWTSQKTYQTAPSVTSTDFSFLAIGDSRSGMSVWNQVAALANAKTPDFTIYTGDIVNSGSSATDWDSWFNNGTSFIENNLVFHSLGNHDAASVPTYQNVFELPKSVPTTGTNLYYSFTYGDAVFIALNSEDPANVTQYNWLVSTLEANSAKKWKIIFFHRPFYTIGAHAGEMNSYFGTWWKAFDDYGVDLIVNGHDHMYERTKPLNRNISTTAPVAQYGSQPGEGRCQIVCGGAGAPLYTGTANWFVQSYQSKYHFCKFDVTATGICSTTYDNNGAVIDSFCLNNGTGKISTTTSASQQFYPIKIAPNPVVDVFSLEYDSPDTGEAFIKISDMNGNVVLSKKASKTERKFNFKGDLSKYGKGVYTVEITVGNQKDTSLLILK